MSRNYYTNVIVYGNTILYRGVKNGVRHRDKINYNPTLFVPSNKKTEWKSLQDEPLEPMQFGSIREARDFLKKYKDVNNFKIFGNDKFEYPFITERHPEEIIDWNYNDLCIANIDIEVGSENGFPEPKTATEPITAIAIKFSNKPTYYVFGIGEYKKHRDDVEYFKCDDEYALIKMFMQLWTTNYPDAITGWNVYGFDIPYIINRFEKVAGQDVMRKLSPWNLVSIREDTYFGKSMVTGNIAGVATLDYMRLFRRFSPNRSQENYRLDTIAQAEGVGQKIAYDDYDGLFDLYKKNYQLFIEYNIRDVELVEKLNKKGRLLEMALTIAYDAKVNYDDIFTQVRMWDAITHGYLYHKKIAIPPRTGNRKSSAYEGAYVKDPQIGMFNWVASFDLNSLYPHLMMQYNISPDTIVEPEQYSQEMREVISKGVNIDKLLRNEIDLSKVKNVAVTPNGQFFKKDRQGFLPELLERMYNDRTVYKTKMLEAKQNYENAKTPEEKSDYAALASRYANLQLTKKECLNSAYGALGSEYFRFFDVRQAEGITMAGQLSIRWIEKKLNEYLNKILQTQGVDYVLASDTDSVYLNLERFISKVYEGKDINSQKAIEIMDRFCEDKLQPFIDRSYSELAQYVNAYSQKMVMKREVLADKAIWTAKKRYILNVYNSEGVQFTEPQMKIQGLEAIKSSTPAACRRKIKEALNIILSGKESEIQDYILVFKEEFKKMPVEDISFPRSMNGLKEYANSKTIWSKGTPIHVRGALVFNHMVDQMKLNKRFQKINNGEKIKFIYLKQPNIFQTDVISFAYTMPKEFNIEECIDYELQFEKSFVDPLKIILDCIGWSVEKVNSLEDFFG